MKKSLLAAALWALALVNAASAQVECIPDQGGFVPFIIDPITGYVSQGMYTEGASTGSICPGGCNQTFSVEVHVTGPAAGFPLSPEICLAITAGANYGYGCWPTSFVPNPALPPFTSSLVVNNLSMFLQCGEQQDWELKINPPSPILNPPPVVVAVVSLECSGC